MWLSGPQFQQFLDALLDAFPTRLSLESMLRLRLGRNLNAIASTNSLHDDVFLLLRKAEAEGWTAELLNASCQGNPGNQLLVAFSEQLKSEIPLEHAPRPVAVQGPLSPPPGFIFQAPPLPGHFVPRQEITGPLMKQLLAPTAIASGVLVISAIGSPWVKGRRFFRCFRPGSIA